MEFQHLGWSPDSRQLAFTARYYDEGGDVEGLESEDVIAVVRIDSQSPVRILTPSLISQVIPDRNGERLALVTGWGVFVLNFADGSLQQLLLVDEPGDRRNYVEDGVWSGSGVRLALTVFDYISNRFQLRELETEHGTLRPLGAVAADADWLTALYYEGDSALIIAEGARADSGVPVSFWRLVPGTAVRKGAVISPDRGKKAWIGDAGGKTGPARPAVYVSDVKGGGRRIVAGPWTNY